jgi:hypothetical protein
MMIQSALRAAMPKRRAKIQEAKKITDQPSSSPPYKFRGHLIRIPDREAMMGAIDVLRDVRVPYCGFADSQLLVMNEHIAALQSKGIPFETVS